VSGEPDKVFTTPHYGPDSARLLVRLAAIEVDELTELVTESWRAVAPDDLLAGDLRPGT